jgi:hypothetical protein
VFRSSQKSASVKPSRGLPAALFLFFADTRKVPRIALGGKGVGVRLREGYHGSFWSAIFMKSDKSKGAVAEIKCPACDGTGFSKVKQPAEPGHRIYPAPRKECGDKGRITLAHS